jgi:hypothetical protein
LSFPVEASQNRALFGPRPDQEEEVMAMVRSKNVNDVYCEMRASSFAGAEEQSQEKIEAKRAARRRTTKAQRIFPLKFIKRLQSICLIAVVC